MRRAALVGAAMAVCVGTVARRRHRARARSVPGMVDATPPVAPTVSACRGRTVALVLAPIVFVVTRAAWPWDPIIDAGGDAIDRVKQWVKDALDNLWRNAAGYLLDLYNKISEIVTGFIEFAISTGQKIANIAWDLAQQGLRFTVAIANAAVAAAQFTLDRFAAAVDFARGIAYDVLMAAARGIDEAKQWVLDTVGRPLYQMVLDVMRWAEDNILAPAVNFASQLVDGVWATVNTLVDMVATIFDFVVNTVMPFFEGAQWLLTELLDFARDPVGYANRAGELIIAAMGPALKQAIVQTVEDNQDAFEQMILRWFD